MANFLSRCSIWLDATDNDGDILKTIDVLAQDVGVIDLFSDWPVAGSLTH